MPELEDMFEVDIVEDCLYLNIFVPQNSANTLKTVMVCILYKKILFIKKNSDLK
jgi:hypothetical protein